MISLYSRWQLKEGYPPEFAEAVDRLVAAVRADEPGTLLYSVLLPAPHPPVGPPPDYEISDDPDARGSVAPNELVFFEIYRDDEAFAAHLRGALSEFMTRYRDYFVTPWQGHPRPETMLLEPRGLFVRQGVSQG